MPSYFYAYFLLAFSTLQHGQCRVLLLDSKIVLNLELIGSRLCPSSAKTTRLPRRESLLIHMLLVQRCQPRHMLRTSDTSLMAHPWTLQATTLYTEVCHGGVWISMVPNAGVAHLFLIWQEKKRKKTNHAKILDQNLLQDEWAGMHPWRVFGQGV